MKNEHKEKRSWWSRRWLRLIILFIIFGVLIQLEQNPSSNPFGPSVVIMNAVVGIWIWGELLLGIVGLIIRLVRRVKRHGKASR